MRHTQIKLSAGLIAAITCLALSATSGAATVTWAVPTNILGDSDVVTTGALVYARNFSQTQLAPTVNGVLFDIFPIPNGSTGAAGIPNVANLGYVNSESSDTAYGSASAPFSGLSANYQALLGSGAGSSTGNALTLTLLNLTNGTTYLFQWWANDSDMNFSGSNFTTASAGNVVSLDDNTTDAAGGLGQFVVGSFTATGTSQVITFSGARPQINGFQLRAVPEPSTVVLGIVGLAGLAVVALRRHARRV